MNVVFVALNCSLHIYCGFCAFIIILCDILVYDLKYFVMID